MEPGWGEGEAGSLVGNPKLELAARCYPFPVLDAASHHGAHSSQPIQKISPA